MYRYMILTRWPDDSLSMYSTVSVYVHLRDDLNRTEFPMYPLWPGSVGLSVCPSVLPRSRATGPALVCRLPEEGDLDPGLRLVGPTEAPPDIWPAGGLVHYMHSQWSELSCMSPDPQVNLLLQLMKNTNCVYSSNGCHNVTFHSIISNNRLYSPEMLLSNVYLAFNSAVGWRKRLNLVLGD